MDVDAEMDFLEEVNLTKYTVESDSANFIDSIWIIAEFIKILLAIIVIAINSLLVYVITRNANIYKSRMNRYVLFFVISNTLYMILEPFVYILSNSSEIDIFCTVNVMQISLMFLCFLFGLCPGIEWYLSHFRLDLHCYVKLHFAKIIAAIVLLSLAHFTLNEITCFRYYFIQFYTLLGTFFVAFVSAAVLNFLTIRASATKDSQKTVYYTYIPSFVIYSWLPCFIYYAIFIFVNEWSWFLSIVFTVGYFVEYVPYSSSIFIFVLLDRKNKQFRMAFDKIFKRSVRNYDGEDLDDILEDDEEDEDNKREEVAPEGNQENPIEI